MEIKNGGISENEIDKYIYQIICQNGTFEIGIFCRILDTSNHELAIALMTNRNVNITNNKVGIITNKVEIIYFEIKNYYDFDKNELKIIEINPDQENLKNIEFINLDYYSILDSCKKNEFNDKMVYLFDLNSYNEKKNNVGIILNINDENNQIEFLCFQKGKISGGFIICYQNNKAQLLGIYESPNNIKYWKDGIFIYEYIKTFYENNDCTNFLLIRQISQNKNKNENSKKNNGANSKNTKKVKNSNNQIQKNNNNVNVTNNNNTNNQNINNNMNYQNNQNITNYNMNYQNNQNITNYNMNYQNNQNITNNNMNYQNNQNLNNNNMNYQNNQNITSNNMNCQNNQNINNNNMNCQNNQNINNNMNYQNNQNITNNNMNCQNNQNLNNNNMNYQNNQNINNNNLNYQNNQNIINGNLNNQNMDIEYMSNNKIINNNNMNTQKMDIDNDNISYQNSQNINNNMNNINNNINQSINNQINNNMNYQFNNSLNNQNNNNMNSQYINNMDNQPNNFANNINRKFSQSVNIIEQESYNRKRNNTFKESQSNYNLDNPIISYNNNQNMNNQYNTQINNISMNNNMNMNYQNYFNINNLNQMNKFTQKTNNFIPSAMNELYGINYEDIYSYIKENKINISFKNKNNEIKNVSIPSSLRNIELYYTANKINNPDFFEYSDFNLIKLYLNNQLISNNDDPITNIVFNGAQIFIMETNKDLSYYDSINQNSQNINKMTIYFNNNSEGKKYIMIFPFNTKPKDILLSFFAKYKIPEDNRKYFTFTFGVDLIDLNDEKTLNNVRITQGGNINIRAYDINISDDIKYSKKDIPGKKLKISLLNKNDELIGEIYAGSLQQIKSFYKILLNYLHRKKIEFTLKPVILISGVETILNESNERTFSSYGILNDFKCKVDGVKNEK